MAYRTGQKDFSGVGLSFTEGVLIPLNVSDNQLTVSSFQPLLFDSKAHQRLAQRIDFPPF